MDWAGWSVMHWDGQSWTAVNVPHNVNSPPAWRAVDGTGPDNVWIVGQYGYILHWDGAVWTEHEPSANPFQPEDFGVVDVDESGVWTRYSNSSRIYRYYNGAWTYRTLPCRMRSQATVRASDTSRWWFASTLTEVWH